MNIGRGELRCIKCGGTIVDNLRTGPKCDNCGASETNGCAAPDPWELVQAPHKFDAESARLRSRPRREDA